MDSEQMCDIAAPFGSGIKVSDWDRLGLVPPPKFVPRKRPNWWSEEEKDEQRAILIGLRAVKRCRLCGEDMPIELFDWGADRCDVCRARRATESVRKATLARLHSAQNPARVTVRMFPRAQRTPRDQIKRILALG